MAGWREGQTLPERFWEHHLVQHRRFSHILRDMDYSIQTSGTACAMLEQAYPGPGPRPLAAWVTLLGALQHADPFVRKTGAHIESCEHGRYRPMAFLQEGQQAAPESAKRRAA